MERGHVAPTPLSERDRARTTRAVAAALCLALVCFVAALVAGLPAGAAVVPADALPGALARLEPAALVSAGVLLLVLAPIARVVGLVAGFWHDGDRPAMVAGASMLVLLALTFVVAHLYD